MNLFLQAAITTWVLTTIITIIGYISSLSNCNTTCIVKYINNSITFNLFGKIFLNVSYFALCPLICFVEWLILAMIYHK